MAIYYKEARKQFVIETANTSYTFFLFQNTLKSAYWGRKLKHLEDVPKPAEELNEVPGNRKVNAAFYHGEFTGWGSRFYNEPNLKVTFADDVRDLVLVYESFEINQTQDILTIVLKDVYYNFGVVLKYQIYEGQDIIDRSVSIWNRTGAEVTLHTIGSGTVNFPYRETPYRLTSMGSAWMNEYEIIRTPVTKSATVLQSKAGLSNVGNLPYFAIDEGNAEENSGEVWFGALQWSGNFKITAEMDRTRITRITAGIQDFDLAYVLKDGEKFETPVFTLGYSDQGFSGASRAMHEYIRKRSSKEYWADKCLPVIYNTWESFVFDIDEKKLMDLADKAAEIGAELFVVDDGWFSNRDSIEYGLGDWEPSPKKFPNGLEPLIRHVNDLGMMFGIWVEPEAINPTSRLYQEHPDWAIYFPTRDRELGRAQLVLNFAREDVCQFAIDFLDELLSRYSIGYLKWDMNRYLSQPGWPDMGKEQQSLWIRYVQNLNRVFRHLHETFPEVILENCASGGLRNDLSVTKWCARTNRSDNHDPVDELYLHEGFTYLFPARYAGGAGHIKAKGTGINARECSMEFAAHVGLMGSLGCSIDMRTMTPSELEELKGYIALHKKIRHVVQLGDLYRLASVRERDYTAMEYVSKDKQEAVVFLFAPVRTFHRPYEAIKLYGLEPDWIYSINEEFTMSGDGLMKYGIPSTCHTLGSMKSKLLILKRKEEEG